MKTILRRIAIYTLTLYLLPFIIPGVHVGGSLTTLFIGGTALALLFMVLKPILSIISFPINLVTLGLFSMITNAAILYLLTRFVTSVLIHPFTYKPIHYNGFVTPAISFNLFFAYVFTAFIVSVIESALSWLTD